MELGLEDIREFSEIYNSNPENKIIENAILKNGVQKTCLKQKIVVKNQPIFNIELPNSKRYNQKESWKCWIYAGINTIKYNMAQNLNVDIMKFELSSNYIAFFDKLEKSNLAYENIIQLSEDDNVDFIRKEKILKYCVAEGGYWQYFTNIINKYGILPERYMPNPVAGEDVTQMEQLYKEKVMKNVYSILQAKKRQESLEVLRKMKKQFLQENYTFLSKILGEPPENFTYEYKDKENNYIRQENLTPIEFKNQFLTLNLDDFVSIGNVPMYNKEDGKVYQKKYLGNVYQKDKITFLNLPINELKTLVIQQLKDNIPVWMSVDIKKYRDKQTGILDIELYDYENILGLKRLTKEESINFSAIEPHHAMTFVGVNVIDGNPERWKIEDSYGTEEKVDGYYIMNDNFFDEFVFNIIVNKQYLTEEQLQLLKQKPIEYDVDEPI